MDFPSDLLAETYSARSTNRALPGAFYTSTEIFNLDLQNFHLRDWVFACHSVEVKQPGSYLVYDRTNESIIIVRGADGTLGALANACRHRGSKLCTMPRGHVKRFVCLTMSGPIPLKAI